MRTIGTLDRQDSATTFSDFLYVSGIENQVEAEEDGTFSLWIIADEDVAKAAASLQRFRENPSAPDFQNVSRAAEKQRKQETKEERSRRSTIADSARLSWERAQPGIYWVPAVLIVLSIAMTMRSHMGADTRFLQWFFISSPMANPREFGFVRALPEIFSGQLWRLVTPIFIHFSILHILFNMMWLYDLGGMIEQRFGRWYFGALVLALAVFSNLGQWAWNGPIFGGMSGVNYGLFGFIWMRAKHDPTSGLALHNATVQMMLIWFVLCLTGFLGPIANAAHALGLGVGALWGYGSARIKWRR